MTDLEPRADRVRDIAESVGGRVLSRIGDVVRIEVPADLAPGLATLWGQGSYLAIYRENDFRCGNPSVTWNIYDVCLTPVSQQHPAPGPAAITAPTRSPTP